MRLQMLYAQKRAELMATIMIIQNKRKRDDILFSSYQEGPLSFAKGTINTVRNAHNINKGAYQRAKAGVNNIKNSEIYQLIKRAIDACISMIRNLGKSLFNATNKLKGLSRDITRNLDSRAPRQDDKLPAEIKTVTQDTLLQMGFNQDTGPKMDAINHAFLVRTEGSLRENLDFSSPEACRNSLDIIASIEPAQAGNNRFTNMKWYKGGNYKSYNPNEFGVMVKEKFSVNYGNFNPIASNKAKDKNYKGETRLQYFKEPKVQTVSTANGQAFTICKEILEDYREDSSMIQMIVGTNIPKYLNLELKAIDKAKRDLDKLNRQNISGTNESKAKEAINQSDHDNNYVNTNPTGDNTTSNAQSYSYDDLILLDKIKSFGEGPGDNTSSTSGTSTNPTVNSQNYEATAASQKGNQGTEGMKDLSAKSKKEISGQIKDTEFTEDGSGIADIYPYLKEFFTNYSIAINNLADKYNATVMNLYTIGRRVWNDFMNITTTE